MSRDESQYHMHFPCVVNIELPRKIGTMMNDSRVLTTQQFVNVIGFLEIYETHTCEVWDMPAYRSVIYLVSRKSDASILGSHGWRAGDVMYITKNFDIGCAKFIGNKSREFTGPEDLRERLEKMNGSSAENPKRLLCSLVVDREMTWAKDAGMPTLDGEFFTAFQGTDPRSFTGDVFWVHLGKVLLTQDRLSQFLEYSFFGHLDQLIRSLASSPCFMTLEELGEEMIKREKFVETGWKLIEAAKNLQKLPQYQCYLK